MDLLRKPTPEQYRATARFHERAALALTLYGRSKEANAARGLAYICRMRAAAMNEQRAH